MTNPMGGNFGMPYIPGWWDQAGPGLMKLTEGIQKMAAPNWEREQAALNLIATDPTKAQQFADAYHENPDLFKGFNMLTKQLQGTKPSLQAQINQAGSAALNANPDNIARAGRKAAGIPEPEDVRARQLENEGKELNNIISSERARIARTLADAEEATATQRIRDFGLVSEALDVAPQFFQSIGGMENLYRAAIGEVGQVDQPTLAKIRAVPEFERMFSTQERAYWDKKNEGYRNAMLNLQRQGNRLGIDEILQRSAADQATRIANSIGFRDVPSLYAITSNPELMNRALNNEPLGNQLLDAAADAIRQDSGKIAQEDIQQALEQFRKLAGPTLASLNDPKKRGTMSDSEYNVAIQNLNAWSRMTFGASKLAPPVFAPKVRERAIFPNVNEGYEVTAGDTRLRQFGGAEFTPDESAIIRAAVMDRINSGQASPQQALQAIEQDATLSPALKTKLKNEINTMMRQQTQRK
jgi:hypothetical protein